MAVVDTDIVVYGSAVMSDDDVTTNIGGAIDLTTRVVFTDISPTGTITVVSDSSGDTTQTVTIYGRDAAGVLVNEGLVLTGVTPVSGSQSFERILKIVMSGTAVGSVSVSETAGAEVLVVMEPGLLEIRRPFYNAVAEASGGADKTYYEKLFFKNTNGTSALTNAVISETADPLAKITFMLPGTLDDSGDNGANNRLVAPAGTFDSTAKNVANAQVHTAGAAQGVWVALTLTNGDAAAKSSFTLRESGETA